ncbi:nucleoside-diphosphate kinase [Chlamydiales bacterium]|nr:nucleoside-diphosphate kinase [Chlamydiales bacterium]
MSRYLLAFLVLFTPLLFSERTFSLIKPDAIESEYVGRILSIYEREGFSIIGIKMCTLSKETAKEFYHHKRKKAYFESLIEAVTEGPVIALVLEGEDIIERALHLKGFKDPKLAKAGTIRSNFGTSVHYNAVHGSSTLEEAEYEINYFFPELSIGMCSGVRKILSH